MITKNITATHIRRAIQKIDNVGFPKRNRSRKYCLVAGGTHYPPKYVIALANSLITGYLLSSKKFEGGKQTNNFLWNLGFTTVGCNCGGGEGAQ